MLNAHYHIVDYGYTPQYNGDSLVKARLATFGDVIDFFHDFPEMYIRLRSGEVKIETLF